MFLFIGDKSAVALSPLSRCSIVRGRSELCIAFSIWKNFRLRSVSSLCDSSTRFSNLSILSWCLEISFIIGSLNCSSSLGVTVLLSSLMIPFVIQYLISDLKKPCVLTSIFCSSSSFTWRVPLFSEGSFDLDKPAFCKYIYQWCYLLSKRRDLLLQSFSWIR